MLRQTGKSPVFWLGTGLGIGLLFGVAMLIGAVVAMNARSPELVLPTDLHATATHGNDAFAIATGDIADGVEGVFFLDFLTGELQCRVINRRTGQLGGQFRQNVFRDLDLEQGKKPKLLMVTGRVPFTRGSGSVRLANSIVYIVDATSGRFAAYSMPWNQTAVSSGRAQSAPMVVIGKGSVREAIIRE